MFMKADTPISPRVAMPQHIKRNRKKQKGGILLKEIQAYKLSNANEVDYWGIQLPNKVKPFQVSRRKSRRRWRNRKGTVGCLHVSRLVMTHLLSALQTYSTPFLYILKLSCHCEALTQQGRWTAEKA